MKTIRERLAGIRDALRMRSWWILAAALMVLCGWLGQMAYVWVAWNWWFVPYQAACRDFNYIGDGDIDDLHFINGELSAEFWAEMREVLPYKFPVLETYWRKDGVLMVPRGFTLPIEDPYWSRMGQEPEERAHWIGSVAAFRLYQKRLAEGVDMAPYAQYVEPKGAYWVDFTGPAPDVCGMMEKLVFKGGELSRPGPGAGAGR